MVFDENSLQHYTVDAGVPQVFLKVSHTVFLLDMNDLPDDVIWNIAMYPDNTTLCSKCD